MVVANHNAVVRHVRVGLLSGTVAARQPPEGHPEVLADKSVYERVDGRIYPTWREKQKKKNAR